MFRNSALSPASKLDSKACLSPALLLMFLSSLAVSVEAAKKSPVVTLFSDTVSGGVYQLVSAAKFSKGCPSMPQVVTEIVGACNVVQGMQNVSVDWNLVSSYLGERVQLMQGAGQAMDTEAVKCMAGFLEAFARSLSASDQFPTAMLVGLSVAACLVILGAVACGAAGGVLAYGCYQGRKEESSHYSRIY